jgi:hypothetical protein
MALTDIGPGDGATVVVPAATKATWFIRDGRWQQQVYRNDMPASEGLMTQEVTSKRATP